MTRAKVWLAVLTAGLLSSTGTTGGAGQAAPSDPPRFRIAVDVVRLDAVVTDKDGKLVTNLTADDFDVHQDGRPQKISARALGADCRPRRRRHCAGAIGRRGPARSARPRQVQRTIMIVVDDLGTSFESYPPMRDALHRLVDEQLGPNDLVAVVRTSAPEQRAAAVHERSEGAARRDRRARVELAIAHRRRGPGAGRPADGDFDSAARLFTAPGFSDLDALRGLRCRRRTRFAALATLIHSTKELPGRKAMIFVSEGHAHGGSVRRPRRRDRPGRAFPTSGRRCRAITSKIRRCVRASSSTRSIRAACSPAGCVPTTT